jgi:hypothetical protein
VHHHRHGTPTAVLLLSVSFQVALQLLTPRFDGQYLISFIHTVQEEGGAAAEASGHSHERRDWRWVAGQEVWEDLA